MNGALDPWIVLAGEALHRSLRANPTLNFRQALVAAGLTIERDLRFSDLSRLDFSDEDLRGADFTGADLRDCIFNRALIAGAKFDGADVDFAALRQAADHEEFFVTATDEFGRISNEAAMTRIAGHWPELPAVKFVEDLLEHHPLPGPVQCFHPARIVRAAHWFLDRFPGETLFSVKVNPDPRVIEAVSLAGIKRFSVTTIAELRAVKAVQPNAPVYFSNPVKPRRAIAEAYYDWGCRAFALDSAAELEKIIAETGGAKDLVLFVRLAEPDEPGTAPLQRKFGATGDAGIELLRKARAKTDELLGATFHVGSQCMSANSYGRAMEYANHLIIKAGVLVDICNVGGGFPSVYPGMTPPPLTEYFLSIREAFDRMFVAQNCELWCEPGRAIAAESGTLLVTITLRKGDDLYLDDGAYGSLFDAAHMRWPYPIRLIDTKRQRRGKLAPFRLFGPTADSFDSMQGPFFLPADVSEGDVIEVGFIGAYGGAMISAFSGEEKRVALVENWHWEGSAADCSFDLDDDDVQSGARDLHRRRARR